MANSFDCKKISISDLYNKKRELGDGSVILKWSGILRPYGKEIEDEIALVKHLDRNYIEIGCITVQNSGEHKRIIHPILLTQVATVLGKNRYYFRCPLMKQGQLCDNRSFVLYRPDGQDYFGCRHCYKIRYPTQIYNKRHSGYSAVKRELIEEKILKLELRDRRPYYKGKKTKREIMIEKLEEKAKRYSSPFY